MTSGSASSDGRAQDALSGRPKVAIVTGASSGIGLEAEEGWSRVVTAWLPTHVTLHLLILWMAPAT